MAIPDPQMMNYDAQLAMQAANMSVPNPRFGGGFGNMMRRANVGLGNGLGKLQQGLFQIDPTIAAKMTPDQINKARNQAMLQMGLGMMNSAGRGAGLGQSIAQGYGGANENLQGGMQQQYQNMRTDQADTRQVERQGVEDTRYQSEWERQQQLDAERRSNDEANRAFRESQAGLDQKRWEKEFGANQGYRGASLALQAAAQGQRGLGAIPSGYRQKADGSGLEFIPGGPADPSVANRAASGKLTGEEQKAVSMAGRMRGAEAKMAESGYMPTGMGGLASQAAAAVPGIGNMVTPADYQAYKQSAMEWITGLLRLDSGAAVPETEFARYFKTYFPQPGDDEKTIQQKTESRQRAVASLEAGMSPAAQQKIPGPSGATGKWSVVAE